MDIFINKELAKELIVYLAAKTGSRHLPPFYDVRDSLDSNGCACGNKPASECPNNCLEARVSRTFEMVMGDDAFKDIKELYFD
jgi:hypothetical protein